MPLSDGRLQDFNLTVDKFLDHAAKWHPAAEVVTRGLDGQIGRMGYAQVRERALRTSGVLAAEGIGQGDRVATLAWNTQGHVEAWYAIMGMGAVCHTLNPRLPASQLAVMLAQSGARVLIASADLAGLAAQIIKLSAEPMTVLAIDDVADAFGEFGLTAKPLERLIADAVKEVPWGEFDERAPCGLCFTSGTTGAPKGVTYTHRGNYLHTLRQLQGDVTGLTGRDSVLTVVPMFHANAWGLPFAAPAVGAKLVLPGRANNGASLAELIVSEGVTMAAGVPTVWLGLMDHLDATGIELPTLRRIMVGGAPMPLALMKRIEDRGIEVQTTWGMTELSPLGTAMPPGSPDRDAAIAGRPALGLDLKLTDSHGHELSQQRGAEGHLWVRGPQVVERYLGAEVPATKDGWFATGDLAVIDSAGRLAITGRAKDLIKSGGEWINPAEIEAIVGAVPGVTMVAVIGREDERWGERPIMLVEVAPGSSLSDGELIEPLRGKIAKWWMPETVVRLEAMPLATTGKVDKLRLRRDYSRETLAE